MIETLEPIAGTIELKVARRHSDPLQEINSPMFLKALRNGPPAAPKAFRRLVEAVQPQLSRYVGRYFRSPEQVQDVLQETWLAVHRALPRFQGLSKLSTWVYSLAYHKICDRLSEKYKEAPLREPDEELGMELEAADPLADEALHQARLVAWIREAAEGIPELYRTAYQLRDVEGLSGEEAAEALKISPTLIRVRLHRARCLIVERLREKHPGAFKEGLPF